MKKILTEIILGFLCILLGMYVGYIYLSGLTNGGNLLLFCLSIVFIGIGIFFLIRSGKSDDTVIAKPDITTSINDDVTVQSNSLLKRNSDLISQWRKTDEQKNRLKILQISATDE